MTVIGAYVLAPDLAVCWADSEHYDEATTRPTGLANKLVVNPAGFVFTMAGWRSVSRLAGCAVLDAPDMATALRHLPGVLRRASEQAAASSRRPHLYATQHAALIGFDPRIGSMIAYRLTAEECFVPLLDERQAVPMPIYHGTDPIGPLQVQALAERQLLRLRDLIPDATGGPLHVAVIRPNGIACNRLCHLAEFAPAVTERVKEPA